MPSNIRPVWKCLTWIRALTYGLNYERKKFLKLLPLTVKFDLQIFVSSKVVGAPPFRQLDITLKIKVQNQICFELKKQFRAIPFWETATTPT